MVKILIVIFSATGNTAKMAEIIKEELKQLGADIERKDIRSYDDRIDPLDLPPYHAVIFGSSIHARRAPRILREWLCLYKGTLLTNCTKLDGLTPFNIPVYMVCRDAHYHLR
jgi:menaquinone-dependent protoporphyrinogen IX oxidase